MDLTGQYKIDKDKVAYRIIDGEAIILNLDNGYYYTLNDVGTRILEAIDKKRSLGEILALLNEEYDAHEGRLKSDLLGLIKDLEKAKLIVRDSS